MDLPFQVCQEETHFSQPLELVCLNNNCFSMFECCNICRETVHKQHFNDCLSLQDIIQNLLPLIQTECSQLQQQINNLYNQIQNSFKQILSWIEFQIVKVSDINKFYLYGETNKLLECLDWLRYWHNHDNIISQFKEVKDNICHEYDERNKVIEGIINDYKNQLAEIYQIRVGFGVGVGVLQTMLQVLVIKILNKLPQELSHYCKKCIQRRYTFL